MEGTYIDPSPKEGGHLPGLWSSVSQRSPGETEPRDILGISLLQRVARHQFYAIVGAGFVGGESTRELTLWEGSPKSAGQVVRNVGTLNLDLLSTGGIFLQGSFNSALKAFQLIESDSLRSARIISIT